MKKQKERCLWVGEKDQLMAEYHDCEWGRPLRDDKKIFEFLTLESFQAGLSWRTILYKRENFRASFANFNPKAIAKFGAKEKAKLMKNSGIIRNRLKIEATINNAQRFLEVQKEFGTFSKYMWSFVGGKPIVNKISKITDFKATSLEAIIFARDLKKRGFKFLGPTTVYAHMQATGMANDHMTHCFLKK